jgi:hypothetical protein
MTRKEYHAQVLHGLASETQGIAYRMPDEGEDFQKLLAITKTLLHLTEEWRKEARAETAPRIGFVPPKTAPVAVKEKVPAGDWDWLA